jgi:hypothetical protein
MPTVDSPLPADALHRRHDRADVPRQPVPPRILADRGIESARARAARNPLLRALSSFGRLLSRTFAVVVPACARRASRSAARETRDRLMRTLNALTAHDGSGAVLAEELRQLAAAQREWARGNPRAQEDFQQLVKETLDRNWPDERGLALVRALAAPTCADAQRSIKNHADMEAERTLVQLDAIIAGSVSDKAFDTIRHGFDAALAALRRDDLPANIVALGSRAVATGSATLEQLRDSQHPQPPAAGEAEAAARERRETARTADILQSCLAECLKANNASPEELATLLRHLPPQQLATLHRPRAAEMAIDEAEPAVSKAIEQEIADRPAHLLAELTDLIEESPAFNPKDHGEWSRSLVGRRLGSELQRVSELISQIRQHCSAFGYEAPEQSLGPLLGELDERIGRMPIEIRLLDIGQLSKIRTAAHDLLSEEQAERLLRACGQRVQSLEQAAADKVQSLLETLAAGAPAAQLLVECKAMIAALRDCRQARRVPEAASGNSAESFGDALIHLLAGQLAKDSLQTDVGSMLAVLRGPEMQAIRGVLAEALREARLHAGLEALHADLADACAALETIAVAVEAASSHHVVRVPAQLEPVEARRHLQPTTLDELSRLFATRVQADGRAILTAGYCAPPFAKSVTETIQQPFSAAERATTQLPGNIVVPDQFLSDALRGTEHFTDDGQPLIDRSGWDSLDLAAKQQRAGEGYRRLVAFYDGNETQAAAIVALAQQGSTAAFSNAVLQCPDHSPVVLEGHGPGSMSKTEQNYFSMTTVRFSKGPNHVPRMTFTYEVRGGLFHPLDRALSPHGIPLDLARSRQQFSVVAEARASEGRLAVIGAPVYDVHLVANPIGRPYPPPRRQDLLDVEAAPTLYQDLIDYARLGRRPEVAAGVEALQGILLAKLDSSPRPAFRIARSVFDRHLREQAEHPLAIDVRLLSPIRDAHERVRRGTERIFDAVFEGAEATRLADFLEAVQAFRQDPERSAHDAQTLFDRFCGAPGREGEPPLFSDELISETRGRIQAVLEAENDFARRALDPLLPQLTDQATRLLPEFTQHLIDEHEAPNPRRAPGVRSSPQ